MEEDDEGTYSGYDTHESEEGTEHNVCDETETKIDDGLEADEYRTIHNRNDRPVPLAPKATEEDVRVDGLPCSWQRDPFATNDLADVPTPSGLSLATLEHNLRHAVERKDDVQAVHCIVDMFRNFVVHNRPTERGVVVGDLTLRLELRPGLGPFSNVLSLRLHQRLFSLLMSIFFRQIGAATPTALAALIGLWEDYEWYLFCRPVTSFARLLSMTTILCHCYKDGSVAYARSTFDDTSVMRSWREEALRGREIMALGMTYTQLAQAQEMLSARSVYFDTRLRLRRYQDVNLGDPHPQYTAQGGPMTKRRAQAYVDVFRRGMPAVSDVRRVLAAVENVMVYLAAQVNNVYARDVYDEVQMDAQVFLYIFRRVVRECQGQLPEYMNISRSRVSCAAACVRTQYAAHLLADRGLGGMFRYGVVGENAYRHPRGGRKTQPSLTALLETMQHQRPPILAKAHEMDPPALERNAENWALFRECSLVQQVPMVEAAVGFLRELYRVHHNWSKLRSISARDAPATAIQLVDSEFFERGSERVLLECRESETVMVEVRLSAVAVQELSSGGGGRPGDGRQEGVRDFRSEAHLAVECLGKGDQTRGVVAVMVGPFDLQEVPRLQKEVADRHELKKRLGVAADVVVVQRLMLHSLYPQSACRRLRMGRVYAWVVHVPRLAADDHICMTISQLTTTTKAYGMQALNRCLLRPSDLVGLTTLLECLAEAHDPFRIQHSYVSFQMSVQAQGVLMLSDVRHHLITERLLGWWPLTRGSQSSVNVQANVAWVQNKMDGMSRGNEVAEARNHIRQVLLADHERFVDLMKRPN